jgi:peptide deformylase
MLSVDDLQLVDDPKSYPAEEVQDIDEEVREWIPAMLGLARRNKLRGLSAPAVGLGKKMFVTNVEGDMMRVFINPRYHVYSKIINGKRREHISIHALNLKDEQFILNTEDGYYEGRLDIGLDMAALLLEMIDEID